MEVFLPIGRRSYRLLVHVHTNCPCTLSGSETASYTEHGEHIQVPSLRRCECSLAIASRSDADDCANRDGLLPGVDQSTFLCLEDSAYQSQLSQRPKSSRKHPFVAQSCHMDLPAKLSKQDLSIRAKQD